MGLYEKEHKSAINQGIILINQFLQIFSHVGQISCTMCLGRRNPLLWKDFNCLSKKVLGLKMLWCVHFLRTFCYYY
jgi:hypothetical protein